MDIIIGGVYTVKYEKLSDTIIKVISYDNVELYCDEVGADKTWTNLSNKFGFYRKRASLFITEKTELIDSEGFSQEELKILRGDLPHRFLRCKVNDGRLGVSSFSDEELSQILDTNKIYLAPTDSKGHIKKSVLIESKDNLTYKEILLKAIEIQRELNGNSSKEIGIFRDGIFKKTPSYYIGHYHDLSGITTLLDKM